MLYSRANAFRLLAVVTFLTLAAYGQSVISTHSGVVHFIEGSVFLDGQPLESHLGKFSSVPQGGELRTTEGRAEVLLTPGVFIRIGERSSIRMVANQLSDTRVELLSGSAVVDSAEPASGTSVTVLYKDWSVHVLEQGAYRIDSDPPRLQVPRGKAEVSAGNKGDALLISQGMELPFAAVLVPSQSPDKDKGHSRDGLSLWADGRRQSISTDNSIAANIQDPATLTLSSSGDPGFTQFPMLGLPSVGPSTAGIYSSLGTYQPGFSSVYLPGYNYLPTYTLVPFLMVPGSYLSTHHPVYGVGGVGGLPYIPRSPIGVGSMPLRPISPQPIPVPGSPRPMPGSSPHPIPVHPTSPPGGATHAVIHR
jgi:hypothetical protein